MEVGCGFHLPVLSFIVQVCSIHLALHIHLHSHTLHKCDVMGEKQCHQIGGSSLVGEVPPSPVYLWIPLHDGDVLPGWGFSTVDIIF